MKCPITEAPINSTEELTESAKLLAKAISQAFLDDLDVHPILFGYACDICSTVMKTQIEEALAEEEK